MARGLRYQHRTNCELITPHGNVQLDEEGYVTNLDELDADALLTVEGMMSVEVFGDRPQKPRPSSAPPSTSAGEQLDKHGPTDHDYWMLIKELTEKGAHLNTEGYIQMETFTHAIRERGWPAISGTRRIHITNEGRERDKKAQAEKEAALKVASKPGPPETT